MNKVAALFGMGSNTQVVALDVNTTISSQSKCTPSAADIIAAAAISTDSLCALQAPTQGDINYNGLSMFTPAPFLRMAILEATPSCSFKIIQSTVQEHENDGIFNGGDIEAHPNLPIM